MNAMKTDTDLKMALAYTGFYQLINRSRLYMRHALTGKVTAPWVREKQRGMIVREARLYVAGYAILLALSLGFQTAVLLWTWLIPLFLGQLFLRPYLFTEHTGCAHTRNAFENTRTTYTNGVVRWFAWNMPYHVEHHAHPSVPFHALPRLNRVVGPHIAYPGSNYRSVVRQTWRALQSSRTSRS
jgi:fatty acid desaturase